MSRTTERFWEDSFDRDDSTTVGNNWSTSGAVQILNQTLRQSGASSAATAYATIPVATAASACGPAYTVGAAIACDSDTVDRSGTLLLRLNGDTSTGDGYGVTLTWETDVLTLKIRKLTSGTWSTLTSVAVTEEAETVSSSFDGVFQRLTGTIFDRDGHVVIEAGFNDEERPRLTYTDKSYPLWTLAGSTGVYFEDDDSGTNGHVFVKLFRLAGISLESDDLLESPRLYSFGKLRTMVRERCLRDSQTNLNDTYFGDLVNEAMGDLHAKLLTPWWWRETYTFQVTSSTTETDLPAKYKTCDSFAYDTVNKRPRPIIQESDYRKVASTSLGSVLGQVMGFRLVGRSPRGGIILAPYPAPNASHTFSLVCWRGPQLMVNDADVPDLPDELVPGLVWAAVSKYTMTTSDRTHAVLADNRAKEWYRDAQRLRDQFAQGANPGVARPGFRLATGMDRAFARFNR